MPTYSYQCDACKHEFEKEQRISEDPIRKCPSCGKQKAKRLITSANFILKGGGWYSDGYGSGSSKVKGSSGGGSSGSGSSGSGGAGSGSPGGSDTKAPSGSGTSDSAPAVTAASASRVRPAPDSC